jgi:hypothetical protein
VKLWEVWKPRENLMRPLVAESDGMLVATVAVHFHGEGCEEAAAVIASAPEAMRLMAVALQEARKQVPAGRPLANQIDAALRAAGVE